MMMTPTIEPLSTAAPPGVDSRGRFPAGRLPGPLAALAAAAEAEAAPRAAELRRKKQAALPQAFDFLGRDAANAVLAHADYPPVIDLRDEPAGGLLWGVALPGCVPIYAHLRWLPDDLRWDVAQWTVGGEFRLRPFGPRELGHAIAAAAAAHRRPA